MKNLDNAASEFNRGLNENSEANCQEVTAKDSDEPRLEKLETMFRRLFTDEARGVGCMTGRVQGLYDDLLPPLRRVR